MPDHELVPVPRPNPLGTAASSVGAAWAAASGVVGALVTFGVLSTVQGDAITAVGAAAPDTITAIGTALAGVIPLLAGLIGAFRTAAAGRDHVTPVADPRSARGVALIEDPAAAARDLAG